MRSLVRVQPVKKGDTLSHIFKRAGLSAQDVYRVINSSKDTKKLLTALKPGQTFSFHKDGETLQQLLYQKNQLESHLLTLTDKSYVSERFLKTLTPYSKYIEGTINSSLFLSAKKAGLSESMTMELANIFGWDIDFVLDIRNGDQFRVIYEEMYLDGEKVKDGNIIAAEFVNQGKTFTAIRFETSDRGVSYFTPDGDSMRKAFLRSPISFARISSHFNLRRKHPVLHTIRAHKGTDYAAATGTPIKVTGNGKVVYRGWKGGYGRVVIVQHGQKYRTLYAHMSKYRRGVNVGSRVKQGQVIGYVGKSGLATGPHLHYEFYKNGSVRNPVTVKLPNAKPISKKDLNAFLAHVKSMELQLRNYASSYQRSLAQAD